MSRRQNSKPASKGSGEATPALSTTGGGVTSCPVATIEIVMEDKSRGGSHSATQVGFKKMYANAFSHVCFKHRD